MRVTQPSNFTAPRNLFPLLSYAVTMVLFVFYIALSMSVFNRFYYAPPNSAPQGRAFESKDNPLSTTQQWRCVFTSEEFFGIHHVFLLDSDVLYQDGLGLSELWAFRLLVSSAIEETTPGDVRHFISHLDFPCLLGCWSQFQSLEHDHTNRCEEGVLVLRRRDPLLSHHSHLSLPRLEQHRRCPRRETYDSLRSGTSRVEQTFSIHPTKAMRHSDFILVRDTGGRLVVRPVD